MGDLKYALGTHSTLPDGWAIGCLQAVDDSLFEGRRQGDLILL